MKPSRKAAVPPPKGEARTTAPTVPGFNSKQQQRNSSQRHKNGKAVGSIDSRTKVIEKTKLVTIGVPFHSTPLGLANELTAILNAYPGSTTKAQEFRLEQALRRWPLTTFEMQKFLDLYDPRARIQGLRLAGHTISRVWVWIETDCGQRHRVGRFAMQRGTKFKPSQQASLFSGHIVASHDIEVAAA